MRFNGLYFTLALARGCAVVECTSLLHSFTIPCITTARYFALYVIQEGKVERPTTRASHNIENIFRCVDTDRHAFRLFVIVFRSLARSFV